MKKSRLLITVSCLGLLGIASFASTVLGGSAVSVKKPIANEGGGYAIIGAAKTNQFWWPGLLNLSPLRDHDASSNPYSADFNYAEAQ